MMKKPLIQIPTAKLRRLEPLKAQTSSATRWSSTYHMLTRDLGLQKFIVQLGDPEIADMLPDYDEHARI